MEKKEHAEAEEIADVGERENYTSKVNELFVFSVFFLVFTVLPFEAKHSLCYVVSHSHWNECSAV